MATNVLSVSTKAYKSFIDRITCVVHDDHDRERRAEKSQGLF